MTIKEIRYWQKNLKSGLIVKYRRYLEEYSRIDMVSQHNYRNIWIGEGPPYTKTIEWDDVIEVYTQKDNPEYFV